MPAIEDGDDTKGPDDASGTRLYASISTKFGQSWTHNEQLVVAPCGIMMMQETFYNAEGIVSVTVSIHLVCYIDLPWSGNALPTHIPTWQHARICCV